MSENKHTPGPWISGAVRSQYDLGESIEIVIDRREGLTHNAAFEHIAKVYNVEDFPCVDDDSDPVEDWDAQAQANARLIAAAPDLLHLVESALESLQVLLGDESPLNKMGKNVVQGAFIHILGTDGMVVTWQAAAKAAINKARGE